MDVNICVMGKTTVSGRTKMQFPAKKSGFGQKNWIKTTGMDQRRVSNAETGIEAVERFLRSIDLYRVDIFELNTFARKIEAMQKRERENDCGRLERGCPAAVHRIDTEGAAT